MSSQTDSKLVTNLVEIANKLVKFYKYKILLFKLVLFKYFTKTVFNSNESVKCFYSKQSILNIYEGIR